MSTRTGEGPVAQTTVPAEHNGQLYCEGTGVLCCCLRIYIMNHLLFVSYRVFYTQVIIGIQCSTLKLDMLRFV